MSPLLSREKFHHLTYIFGKNYNSKSQPKLALLALLALINDAKAPGRIK